MQIEKCKIMNRVLKSSSYSEVFWLSLFYFLSNVLVKKLILQHFLCLQEFILGFKEFKTAETISLIQRYHILIIKLIKLILKSILTIIIIITMGTTFGCPFINNNNINNNQNKLKSVFKGIVNGYFNNFYLHSTINNTKRQ